MLVSRTVFSKQPQSNVALEVDLAEEGIGFVDEVILKSSDTGNVGACSAIRLWTGVDVVA